jgi:hypothetical protein
VLEVVVELDVVEVDVVEVEVVVGGGAWQLLFQMLWPAASQLRPFGSPSSIGGMMSLS